MDIVFIVNYARPHRNAGSETVTHNIARRMVEAGHNVTIYATRHGRQKPVVLDGVRIHTVPTVGLAGRHRQRVADEGVQELIDIIPHLVSRV